MSSGCKIPRFSLTKPVLYVPYYPSKASVCPARVLEAYLDKTITLRRGHDFLFVALNKLHKRVSSQTLSRWIKTTLKDSGIDTSMFTAHSTRHAATSYACTRGISLDVIRSTAGWSNESRTFARFYNRPIVDKNAFARSILAGSDVD